MLTDAASKAVLVSAPEGLFVFDREGRIVFVNSQIDELFGYAPGELLGQSLEMLLPVLFWKMRELQSAASIPTPGLSIERYGLEQMGYRKDRAEILLQVSVGHVEVQDRPLECCIVREIATFEQQSRARNEFSDQFRQMVENSHDILTIRDADGRVRYISPSIHSVLGYKQEEIIGSTGFELLHPAVRGVVINGRDISQRKQEEAGKDQKISELQQTLANVKTLTGVLPICASCKKIQEAGNWQQIEAYIRDRSQVEFSHTMCPECTELWYPEYSQS